jgi:hypothetical protein
MSAPSDLPRPEPSYVQERIAEFNMGWGDDERAVSLVFKQWPSNVNYPEVLIKTIVTNQLYSTHILDVRTVARRIVSCSIDERLSRGDESVVDEIAHVQFKGKANGSVLLSFATKYCSWHEPERFQILDTRVEQLLRRYQKQFTFTSIDLGQLRDYRTFLRIIDDFKAHFGLSGIGRKDLDKFLWIEGKDKLP